MSTLRSAFFALSLSVLLLPAAALAAQEQSKIQIALDPVVGGVAARNGAKLRTHFVPGVAVLLLTAKGLAPSTEHLLLSNGVEMLRFTTTAKGTANVKVDLMQQGQALLDPRGTLVTIHDGTTDVHAGWLYGPVENDPSRVHINESTFLEPDAVAAPSGTAHAHYMMTPNRKAKLRISLVHATPGEYEVWVDGVRVGAMTTNPAGNASADFRSDLRHVAGGKKGGKSTKVKLPLDFDPRMAWIELRMAGAPAFAGLMAAQIGGMNLCLPTENPLPMTATDAQPAALGTMTIVLEEDCSRQFSIAVARLVPGTYDVVVDGVPVGAFTVLMGGFGEASFDTSPDAVGELPMNFALPSGATVAISLGGVDALVGVIP